MLKETESVPYVKIHTLAESVIRHVAEEGGEVGMAILAFSLAIGRLMTLDRPLTDEAECKWIEDFNEWSVAYFSEGSAS